MNLGTFYVCRKIGTQDYFLERPLGFRGGYSFQEPGPVSQGTIRLFRSRKAAFSALIMWSKGELRRKVSFTNWEDEREELYWKPVPGRSRDAIEIVTVVIKEVSNA